MTGRDMARLVVTRYDSLVWLGVMRQVRLYVVQQDSSTCSDMRACRGNLSSIRGLGAVESTRNRI